jgi:hypothetical protein
LIDEIKDLKPRIQDLLIYFDDKYGEDSWQSLTTLRMFEILQIEIERTATQ